MENVIPCVGLRCRCTMDVSVPSARRRRLTSVAKRPSRRTLLRRPEGALCFTPPARTSRRTMPPLEQTCARRCWKSAWSSVMPPLYKKAGVLSSANSSYWDRLSDERARRGLSVAPRSLACQRHGVSHAEGSQLTPLGTVPCRTLLPTPTPYSTSPSGAGRGRRGRGRRRCRRGSRRACRSSCRSRSPSLRRRRRISRRRAGGRR